MFKVKSDNPNYLAKLVKLGPAQKVPNSDRLQYFLIDGNSCVTDLKAQEGQYYVYFPVESAICPSFLTYTNSYSEASLNADKTKKGFFGNSGRVKCVKLRGAKSEGYIIAYDILLDWLRDDQKVKGQTIAEVNSYFDSFDDILICEKYVNREALRKLQNANKKQNKKAVRQSRLVDLQFRFHEDTKHLKKEISRIQPDDLISISYKMHGASCVLAKVLTKKSLSTHQKILKFFGADINENVYDLLVSSRKVIKNQYNDTKGQQSYYKEDIWGNMATKYKDSIKDGISIYAEIVGQMSSGGWVQKMFDYGQAPNTHDMYVYRMTYTSAAGDVFEFTMPQIQRYCAKYGMNVVQVFYYGKAKDLYQDIAPGEHWHQNLLDRLLKTYTEKDCFMCANKVPEEGIVVVKEGEFFEAYKLKSFRFLEKESKDLDEGNVDVETAESITSETPEIQE